MNSTPSQIPTPPVVCLGELLVDLIADKPGRLSEVSSFQKCPGGAPANVAVGIARLGTPCGFIGKVGADVFGKFLVAELARNQVNTQGIIYTDQAPTALAFVSRSETGEREFLFYREPCADVLLTETELPLEWLHNTKYLHCGGVSLTRNPSRQATTYAMQVAKKHGATISFDPNLRPELWVRGLAEYQQTVKQILSKVDIFLPSEDELAALVGKKDQVKALYEVHALGPSIICLKLGKDGSLISTQADDGTITQFTQAPFDVPVLDTTGAGDGFNAGLLVGLANGLPLADAVIQGTSVASLVITKIGAMTALPTLDELVDFQRKSGHNFAK
jgi:fructokinase